MNIEEIARKLHMKLPMATQEDAIDFAHRLIAAVQEAQEPSHYKYRYAEGVSNTLRSGEPPIDIIPLFTFPPAAAIPEGMVLVPQEPTEAMMEAWRNDTSVLWADTYRAMIAAYEGEKP